MKNIKKYLIVIILFSIITIFSSNSVTSADVWDRPVAVIDYSNVSSIINMTLLNYYTKTETNLYFNYTEEINNLNISLTNQISYVNLTIWNELIYLDNKINNLNNSLTSLIQSNFTYLMNLILSVNDTILLPSGKYFYNDTDYFYMNETELNTTINNISENKHKQYIDYINVSSGSAYYISNYSIEYLITNIKINGPSNSFRSEVTEYPQITNIIDKNRIPHNQNWSIEKNYAINNSFSVNITNSISDGMFQIIIDYVDNGLN